MNKAKKFICPVIFAFICVLCFFVLFTIILEDAGMGGAVIVLGVIILLLVVIIPCYCFIYSKKLLFAEKRKYLFTFYNSFVLTMFYLLPLCTEGETYIYSLILFLWVEWWNVLPLFIHRKADKTSTE